MNKIFNDKAFDTASIGYVDYKILDVSIGGKNEISVGKNQPTEETIQIWINTNADMVSIPEIKDDVINTTDTWSSQKIKDAFDEVREMLKDDEISILGQAVLGTMILGKGE